MLSWVLQISGALGFRGGSGSDATTQSSVSTVITMAKIIELQAGERKRCFFSKLLFQGRKEEASRTSIPGGFVHITGAAEWKGTEPRSPPEGYFEAKLASCLPSPSARFLNVGSKLL